MFCAQCGQWAADDQTACGRCGATLGGTAIGPLPGVDAAAHASAASAAEAAVQYAGFWRRFAVLVVDYLVLYFPSATVQVALGLDPLAQDNLFSDPAYWSAAIFAVLLWWLYCALLESSPAQGTLGQQLLGIRVCDARLRRISFLRATARFFAQTLSLCICGIGYLVNLWTKRRQALHDLVAGCVHVRSESLAAPVTARTESA